MLRTLILMTRGIILDPRTRRWAMFILIVVSLLMAFAGSTFLTDMIGRGLAFVVYWLACAWCTLAALLLALWDLLLIRTTARRERNRLEKEVAQRKRDEET